MRLVCRSLLLALFTCTMPGARAAGDPPGGLVGGLGRHVVARGESWRSIGARYGIDASTLAADNALTASAPLHVGQELTVDNRHVVPAAAVEGVVVVNIPQRMLFLRARGQVFGAPVAVGSRGWQTPVAPFTVRSKEVDPTWDVPASIVREALERGQSLPSKVPPGPANPLGPFWLGLSIGSVGLHGTNAPASIYGAVTHGCIRVHSEDIAVLFDLVDVGTSGVTLYEPILIVEQGGEIYLEAHPDVYRRLAAPPKALARNIALALGITDRIDWTSADAVVDRRQGIARAVTAR